MPSIRAEAFRQRAAQVRQRLGGDRRLRQLSDDIAGSFERLADTAEFWDEELAGIARVGSLVHADGLRATTAVKSWRRVG